MKSYKSSILLILLAINALPCAAKIIYPTTSCHEYTFTPDNTLFMFDVDKVLIMRFMDQPLSFSKMKNYWSLFWNLPNKLEIIKIMPTFIYERALLQNQIKKYDGIRIAQWLYDRYPELKTAETTINQFAAKAQPIEGTIDILNNLKEQGFDIAIATNQGSRVFERLVKDSYLPPLSTYSLIFTPDFEYPHDQPGPEEGFVKKPMASYYDTFKNAAQRIHEYTHFIFIDDRLKNVEAAAQQGIIGIHFTTPENLEKDLSDLGINLESLPINLS